ncbi:MAG TPA: cytochrome C oxidase Cbb3 [Phycisphaerales bacterium]|nr:cytochrome C oxidase Cbb3 [Phycisphaerales bacterium]
MTADPSVNAGGRLLDHNYDGIQEYDNPTPGWWHLLFIGSIAFSLIYAAVYHFEGPGRDPHEALASDQNAYYERLFGDLEELKNEPQVLLALPTRDGGKWQALAGALFIQNCAQCHGAKGEGLNGPNLTDDSYIHIKQITDILAVITDGVGAKGMPAWGVRFNPNQRMLLAAYVASLRGTTPPGAKAPEGDPAPPWPAVASGAPLGTPVN